LVILFPLAKIQCQYPIGFYLYINCLPSYSLGNLYVTLKEIIILPEKLLLISKQFNRLLQS